MIFSFILSQWSWSDVMKFRSFGDRKSSRVQEIKKKIVTIVNSRVNERSSNIEGSNQ